MRVSCWWPVLISGLLRFHVDKRGHDEADMAHLFSLLRISLHIHQHG